MLKIGLQLLLTVCILLFSSEIFSQQNNETIVSIAELGAMADGANFQGNIATSIHNDSKSTFFAILEKDLSSRYVE